METIFSGSRLVFTRMGKIDGSRGMMRGWMVVMPSMRELEA
jgi:hypothetical protein